ncbi:MAG: hypothetical protein LBO64_04985 [Desulfovibrio sp.]|jgi:hypothetical protein|nr:hypothetical protein [Desulfovibrio sp.]
MSQLPLLNFGESATETNSPPKPGSLPFLNFGDADSPQKVRSLLRTGPDATPEQTVQDVQLSRDLNMPPDMVGMDRKAALDMKREKDISAALQGFDHTAAWMSQKPWNLGAAQDDVKSLTGIENALRGTVDTFSEHYAAGEAELEHLNLLDRKLSGDNSPELSAKIAESEKKKSLNKPADAEGAWGSFVQNSAEQTPIQLALARESIRGRLIGGSFGAAAGTLIGGAGGSIVPVAGTLAGAAGGAATGAAVMQAAGGAAFTAFEGFRLERASAYGEYSKSGMDDGTARMAANIYGVISGAIEGGTDLVGDKILGWIGVPVGQAEKAAVKLTAKRAVFDFFKNMGKLKLMESGEEGLQQFAQNIVGEVGKKLSGLVPDFSLENLGEGVLDSIKQSLWSAIGAEKPTINLGLDLYGVRQERLANERIALRDSILAGIQSGEQAMLSELDGFSAQSKLAQRDPLMYEDAMRHLAQGAPIKNVYIPAQGIMDAYADNTTLLNGALETLGVSQDDYQLALNSGGDLIVPVEKYATAVAADAEFVARIADNRRLTEDGFTVSEYREFTAQRQEEVERLLADAQTEQEAATQLETESREIFETTRDMLVTVGRPMQEARSDAALTAAFFATMAQRSNGKSTPRQLWEKYAPNILGPNVGALAHLNAGIEKDLQELGGFSDVQEAPAPSVAEQPPTQETQPQETPATSTQGQTSGVSAKPADEVVTHTDVQSLDDLYALAAQTLPDFQANISNIAGATGGQAMFRSAAMSASDSSQIGFCSVMLMPQFTAAAQPDKPQPSSIPVPPIFFCSAIP